MWMVDRRFEYTQTFVRIHGRQHKLNDLKRKCGLALNGCGREGGGGEDGVPNAGEWQKSNPFFSRCSLFYVLKCVELNFVANFNFTLKRVNGAFDASEERSSTSNPCPKCKSLNGGVVVAVALVARHWRGDSLVCLVCLLVCECLWTNATVIPSFYLFIWAKCGFPQINR